ncbi:hypothetical protein F4678DRAFT_131769 [Xylaria arbuscula]|nr:hypothetical protein F4678DRAFT_131769 [Xylaria arbuscula]
MSGLPPVYIVSAARTPVGSFLGYALGPCLPLHFDNCLSQHSIEPQCNSIRLCCHQGYVGSRCPYPVYCSC